MSGIVLSASVRQNLLSLQSTADLLATTQNRLSTGKKVNSALDNPTNFFTAQGLDARAGDINNLLDSIGNGVQVLQAANTGITSLQKLVDSAKSVANQVLQSPVAFSQKSSVTSTAIAGATALNLLGTPALNSATAFSSALQTGASGTATSTSTLGGTKATVTGSVINAATTSASLLNGTASAGDANAGVAANDTFTVNGKTITFEAGAAPGSVAGFTQVAASGGTTSGNVFTDANGNAEIFLGTGTKATVGDVLTAIDIASGVQSNVAGTLTLNTSQTASTVNGSGALVINSSTGADLTIVGKTSELNALGLNGTNSGGNTTVTATRAVSAASLNTPLITDGSTLAVDGHTITFKNAPTPTAANVGSGLGLIAGSNVVTDGNGNSTVFLEKGAVSDVLKAIDLATGVQTATNTSGTATVTTAAGQTVSSIDANGKLNISTGVAADLTIGGTGNALAALGLTAGTTSRAATGPTALSGLTLTIGSTGGGTATNITFGTGAGQVKSLNDLNNALAANNLQATIDSTGAITITTTNDAASATLNVVGGTATGAGKAFAGVTAGGAAPVQDPTQQAARAGLVSQFNNILQQINTTAQDSSFNGINLLTGDTLKLTFDESGKSTLNINGATFNTAGLGLATLTAGTDFIDSNSANKQITALNAAGTTLRTEASTLGSNLSIVQIRQDFNKNLINVLQTGSSNLTLADTNEEAANSQALSTRQSIAVSALALANQSQQSVLQLLR
jgi:flagellin